MSQKVIYGSKVFTKAEVEELPTRELVEIYNSLSETKVKKFTDRKTAVRRTWERMLRDGISKQPPPPKRKHQRGMKFEFAPDSQIRTVREGTKRATLVEMLSRPEGATFTECQQAIGWDRKTTYEGIRLLHFYVGYGMKQGDSGRIHLVTK